MSQVPAGDPASSKGDSSPQTNAYDEGLDEAFEAIRSLGDHHLAEMDAVIQRLKEHAQACQARTYQIKVEGRLDASWSGWFNDMTITLDRDATILTGPVADQAALRGMLCKLWDLNLTLISVRQLIATKEGGNE